MHCPKLLATGLTALVLATSVAAQDARPSRNDDDLAQQIRQIVREEIRRAIREVQGNREVQGDREAQVESDQPRLLQMRGVEVHEREVHEGGADQDVEVIRDGNHVIKIVRSGTDGGQQVWFARPGTGDDKAPEGGVFFLRSGDADGGNDGEQGQPHAFHWIQSNEGEGPGQMKFEWDAKAFAEAHPGMAIDPHGHMVIRLGEGEAKDAPQGQNRVFFHGPTTKTEFGGNGELHLMVPGEPQQMSGTLRKLAEQHDGPSVHGEGSAGTNRESGDLDALLQRIERLEQTIRERLDNLEQELEGAEAVKQDPHANVRGALRLPATTIRGHTTAPMAAATVTVESPRWSASTPANAGEVKGIAVTLDDVTTGVQSTGCCCCCCESSKPAVAKPQAKID